MDIILVCVGFQLIMYSSFLPLISVVKVDGYVSLLHCELNAAVYITGFDKELVQLSIRFYSNSLDVVSAENWNHKVKQKALKNYEPQLEDKMQDNKYRKQDKGEGY